MVGWFAAKKERRFPVIGAESLSHAGTIHHAGFKFGRWLDLGFFELRL